MNLFYLDQDIEKCVQYHNDKHVVKMILEYTQLLSSVHHITGTANTPDTLCYKLTHKNHPCAVWARTSKGNYQYLYTLAKLLTKEYTHRYGKTHKTSNILEHLPEPSNVPDGTFTEPPKCVHDDFKDIPDTITAYRQYYLRDKRAFCKWTKRNTPEWFV